MGMKKNEMLLVVTFHGEKGWKEWLCKGMGDKS